MYNRIFSLVVIFFAILLPECAAESTSNQTCTCTVKWIGENPYGTNICGKCYYKPLFFIKYLRYGIDISDEPPKVDEEKEIVMGSENNNQLVKCSVVHRFATIFVEMFVLYCISALYRHLYRHTKRLKSRKPHEEEKADVVIFCGSNSGVDEYYARLLQEECTRKKILSSVETLSADPLPHVKSGHIIIFILQMDRTYFENYKQRMENWLKRKECLKGVEYGFFGVSSNPVENNQQLMLEIDEHFASLQANRMVKTTTSFLMDPYVDKVFMTWMKAVSMKLTSSVKKTRKRSSKGTLLTYEDIAHDNSKGCLTSFDFIKATSRSLEHWMHQPTTISYVNDVKLNSVLNFAEISVIERQDYNHLTYRPWDRLFIQPSNEVKTVVRYCRRLNLDVNLIIKLDTCMSSSNNCYSFPAPKFITINKLLRHHLYIHYPLKDHIIHALRKEVQYEKISDTSLSKMLYLPLEDRPSLITFMEDHPKLPIDLTFLIKHLPQIQWFPVRITGNSKLGEKTTDNYLQAIDRDFIKHEDKRSLYLDLQHQLHHLKKGECNAEIFALLDLSMGHYYQSNQLDFSYEITQDQEIEYYVERSKLDFPVDQVSTCVFIGVNIGIKVIVALIQDLENKLKNKTSRCKIFAFFIHTNSEKNNYDKHLDCTVSVLFESILIICACFRTGST